MYLMLLSLVLRCVISIETWVFSTGSVYIRTRALKSSNVLCLMEETIRRKCIPKKMIDLLNRLGSTLKVCLISRGIMETSS